MSLQPFPEIGRRLGIRGLQIDYLIALDHAEPRSTLPCKGNNFHELFLP